MPHPKKITVLIPDADSWLSFPVLNCLGQIPNVNIVLLSSHAFDPVRFSKYAHQFFSYPKDADEACKLRFIADKAKETAANLVLPIDIATIRFLSTHKHRFLNGVGLALVPEVQTIDTVSNKWTFAEWLLQNQVPAPATLVVRQGDEFVQELKQLPLPVLLKPTQQIGNVGVGGRGIEIFHTYEQLLAFCSTQTSIEYIAQPYIEGNDIGCSVLCQEGKILAHTIQVGVMNSKERFAPAAAVNFMDHKEVYHVVQDLMAKLNWSGVANIDLRYDPRSKQVYVLEINARFWGSLLGSLCAGVNFPYLACLAGLGYKLPPIKFKNIRYANGYAALTDLFHRYLQRKSNAARFDHSILEFMVKDPLPKFVNQFQRQINKVL